MAYVMYNFKTGDIVHTHGNSWVSRMIRWFSTSMGEKETWTNHSAMVINSGCSLDEPTIIEALHKVKINSLYKYMKKDTPFVVHRLKRQLSSKQEKALHLAACKNIGRRYGYFKIIVHAMDKLLNNQYVFRRILYSDQFPICSWVVAHCYEEAGLSLGGHADELQPDDILDFLERSPDFYEVYRFGG